MDKAELGALFRDNWRFLRQDISDYVLTIMQLISAKGPLPQLVEFLIPLCSCDMAAFLATSSTS